MKFAAWTFGNQIPATIRARALGTLDSESKCGACHFLDQGRKLGPDMLGVTRRRIGDWLTRRLRSPEKMLEMDDAKVMLTTFLRVRSGRLLYTLPRGCLRLTRGLFGPTLGRIAP